MKLSFKLSRALAALTVAAVSTLLVGCGGGGDAGSSGSASSESTAGGSSTPSFGMAPAMPPSYAPGYAGAPAAIDDTIPTDVKLMLADVNAARKLAGVPALKLNADLVNAAASHANYMVETGELGYAESNSSAKSYTGANPMERTKQGSKFVATQEFFALAPGAQGDAMADWYLTGLHSRIALLDAAYTVVGSGIGYSETNGTLATVDVGMLAVPEQQPAVDQLVVWPAQGGKVSAAADYSKYPRGLQTAGTVVGYPVSIQTDFRRKLTVASFKLVAADGSEVATSRLTADSDATVPAYAAAIVPAAPLQSGTTYTVYFEGVVDGTPVTKVWSFQTEVISVTAITSELKVSRSATVFINGLDVSEAYYVCAAGAQTSHWTMTQRMVAVTAQAAGIATVTIGRDSACSQVIGQVSFNVTQ